MGLNAGTWCGSGAVTCVTHPTLSPAAPLLVIWAKPKVWADTPAENPMLKPTLIAAFTLSSVAVAAAQSTDVTLVRAPTAESFKAAFCGADRSGAQIFDIPLNTIEPGATLA